MTKDYEKENIFEFLIDEEMQGTRLDVVLSFSMEGISRSFIQKLIEEGKVKIDDKVCTSKKEKLSLGKKVEITIPEPEVLEIKADNIPIDIVYEDDDLLIVNKPKGMVVHPAPGNYEGTLVNALMYHCKDSLSTINGIIRPGIVHRIDKDTSGLLMVAKNDMAHAGLASQLEVHSINRTYRAIVYNNFTDDEGRIEAPIGRDPNNRLRQAIVQNGRSAATNYKVIERFGKYTYIEARLETGRTHQIRVHMAYIKHPLLGDTLYGPANNTLGAIGQTLHAKTLGFVHPRSGEYIEFDSEIPKEFEAILTKLRNGRR